MTEKNVISITDLIALKEKRELELKEYETQLRLLKKKKEALTKSLNWIDKEIQMSTFIISTVRKEITPDELVKEVTKDPSLIHYAFKDKENG